MNQSLQDIPLWLLIPLVIVLLIQGTWLFADARRRQINPWFWGIWGLIQLPLPTIFYVLFIYWKKTRNAEEDAKDD